MTETLDNEKEKLADERDACRAALEQVIGAVNRYREAHSKIESRLFTTTDERNKGEAYVNMLIVVDDMEKFARPSIPYAQQGEHHV